MLLEVAYKAAKDGKSVWGVAMETKAASQAVWKHPCPYHDRTHQ